MKRNFYPALNLSLFRKAAAVCVILVCSVLLPKAKAQGLVFKNSYLQSGTAGQVNAVYRFPSVSSGVDALVKISGRSSSNVKLESIDLTNTGWDKAWQPQVSYNNGTTPNGITDWYMEFTITFVNSGGSALINAANFSITALDIDGNGDKINEWVGIYGHKNYTLESNSLLSFGSIWELLSGINTLVGTKFAGPTTNFGNIDTGATRVMSTTNFETKNSLRIRTGGHSTGHNSAAERMYSFWFKSFSYNTPANIGLPVALKSFTAKLENKKPVLNWVSSKEENFSHYVLERSTDGSNFSEAAMVFANGNSTVESKYAFTDNAVTMNSKALVYYRLRMVDIDGKYKYSETRLLRLTETVKALNIQAYPNPAVNELRITIPAEWQDQKVRYDVFSTTGQAVRSISRNNASQTEVIDISKLSVGSYIIKVSVEKEHAIQQFVKNR